MLEGAIRGAVLRRSRFSSLFQRRSRPVARVALLALALSRLASAALTVQPAADASPNTARALATLLAPGVTLGTASLIGNNSAAGTFSGGISAGLDLDQGILFSTGAASDAAGPNDDAETSTIWEQPLDDEDLQLSQLLDTTSTDAAGVTFTFTCPASAPTVQVNYIFASDEYAGFSDPADLSDIREGVAILVDGVNAATLPGGAPVSVPNLKLFAADQFRDNNLCHQDESQACPFALEADGFSAKLTATAPITAGTHTAKIVIADDFLEDIDSWVFLSAFTCGTGHSTAQVADLGLVGTLCLGLGLFIAAGLTRRAQRLVRWRLS